MAIKKSDSRMDCDNKEEDDVPLPGFRFHPSDEELVGFYLRRKVERKHFNIELIKHVDIYKFDPWDLPKSSNVGDKEWYFFCKRGRKYKNSARPNRVANSGFWKATGIDKPIYSIIEGRQQCIGLKKSLVYYRGSAGRGTKTEWMMHEFRLPDDDDDHKSTKHIDVRKITTQEVEVWTLCRILKRNTTTRKCMPDWKELSITKHNVTPPSNASSISCSADSDNSYDEGYKLIDFRAPIAMVNKNNSMGFNNINEANSICSNQFSSTSQPTYVTTYSNSYYRDVNEIIKTGDWDEIGSILDFNVNTFHM